MPLSISYMGTKRQLATFVAELAAEDPEGPFLDLFSGMCSVAHEIGPSRPIWCNDIQNFSYCVAKANLCSGSANIKSADVVAVAQPYYLKNFARLADRFSQQLELERRAISSMDLSDLNVAFESFSTASNSLKIEMERRRLAKRPRTFPYRLFTITYAGGYFSLEQCLEIDSIKYSIDCLQTAEEINKDESLWLCLALCRAISKISNTTGHFAQYLRPKEKNQSKVFAKKRRSVWNEWLLALPSCSAIGSVQWRKGNRAFNFDANQLLCKLEESKKKPKIIYADPPYTADHYSRYYHMYETLTLYDYPQSFGFGQYRPDRFVSPFSTKSKIAQSLDELFRRSARLGSSLILSYPNNGLLNDSKAVIVSMLQKYFTTCKLSHEVDYLHSSLGASKGKEKHDVTEMIYIATP